MPVEAGHISWRMPIVSSIPPRMVPVETPSRPWTPFVQSKLPFEHQSPICPLSTDNVISATVSSIEPRITASASDESLRSSLSAARAELGNSTFQIDHLRKLVLDLEQQNAKLKSDNSSLQHQQKVEKVLRCSTDVSKSTPLLEQELRRLQDELNQCEQRYQEAVAHHRLEKISIEADRDAKSRELKRVQQELEEITILYKGKDRCLRQLQELHEAQFSKDGHSKAEDRRTIGTLTSHCSKLRDALSKLKQRYDAERTKCADHQKKIEMMKRLLDEADSKYEKCNTELISSREEIDELLTQLSEIECKRRQAGGDRVHQGSSSLKSDAISAMAAAEPARSSTPTDLSDMVNAQSQRVLVYKDASTSTFADTISDTVHPEVLQKKLLDTEAQLSSERATICQLRTQILEMEEREKESENLFDMLQAELETVRKSQKSYPTSNLDKTDENDSKSTLLELCMDECNQLRRQNSELAAELDRARNELQAKDDELQMLHVRLMQRPVPLHNPVASSDATTVVNDTVTHAASFSQVFSPISFANR